MHDFAAGEVPDDDGGGEAHGRDLAAGEEFAAFRHRHA